MTASLQQGLEETMSHEFDFADINDATALLTTSLSVANIAQRMSDSLTALNEAFGLAASDATCWPEGGKVHRCKADILSQITAMLMQEAANCDSDPELHFLRDQVETLVSDATKFLADVGCMGGPVSPLFDSTQVTWRVRRGFEWCFFAAPIEWEIPKLEAVSRAIEWRMGALLKLNPEQSQKDLEKAQRFISQDDLPDLAEYSPAFFTRKLGISEQGVTASLRRWIKRYPKYRDLVFDGTRWRIEDRELAKSFVAFHRLNARRRPP